MAAEGLDKFKAPNLAIGIDINRSDFSPNLVWTKDAYNVTSGIQQGIGPRYGVAPIPGHMDREAPGGTVFPGLMRAEQAMNNVTGGGSTWTRLKVYAIVPFRFRGVGRTGNIGAISTYYAVVIGYNTSLGAGLFFDVLVLSTQPTGYIEQASDIRSGIPSAGADSINQQNVSLAIGLIGEKMPVAKTSNTSIAVVTSAQRNAIWNLSKDGSGGKNYASVAPFSVAGADIPMAWIVGGKIAAPDATHTPSLNIQMMSAPTYGSILGGQPSQFPQSSWQKTTRTVYWWCWIDTFAGVDLRYQATIAADSLYNGSYVENPTDTNIAQVTATRAGAYVTYGSVLGALYNDAAMRCNCSYQGMLIASGKAIAVIFQDWYRSCLGELQQYIDLTTLPQPQFNLATSISVTFGAAGTGILRQDTAYQFGMAIYDKRLNYETNVQDFGAVYTTGANDFVDAILFSTAGTANLVATQLGGGTTSPVQFPEIFTAGANAGAPYHINYLEYRFYYRALGMAEWLPALFVDAAQYWFYPWPTAAPLAMCQGGIGGVPGGRIGGFTDFAQLPNDIYNCAVMYKNRAFWLSDKSLYFSLTNNIFAYPGRNSAACPAGSWRGALVHAYYGQADQDARLVIFSTAGTFVGKFTGNLIETAVQVSTDTVANFGLDGSDFVINPWTSVSAFSYRSAIVAKGILYLWGPQGIFKDDGVQPIVSISEDMLEPDIFGFYDPNRTDEIHCTYNDTTKEIIWFYPPKTADGYATHALVYNTLTKTFLPQRYDGTVDAAQQLAIDTAIPTAGTRSVIHARGGAGAIQRSYFYDHNNRAGDIFPTGEMMVKQISTPAAGQRRLTLAAGYDGGQFATIAAGDLIALTQVARYATSLVTPADFIATVAATNAGTGTIDINLPTGVTFDAAAGPLAEGLYFPIWHAAPAAVGINGFSYNVPSKYWCGDGGDYWAQFLYIFWQMRVNLLPTAAAAQQLSLAYRTPISDVGPVTDVLTFANNSDGNWQLYHPLQIGDQNAEGQGLKFTISGIQIASEWVLQYLELHAIGMDGDQLKTFEG